MKHAFENLANLNAHILTECAWCRKQTIASFCAYIVEEAKEELGDLIWNIIFLSHMAEKQGLFTLKGLLEDAHKKLHARHPHVFKEKTDDIDRIWELYNQVKAEEKKAKEGRPKRPINS